MKMLVFAVGVLGLAALFGMSEPSSASAQPVTSADVRLVSEKVSDQASENGRTCINVGQKNVKFRHHLIY
jgi:hypothetical protein